MARTGRPGLLSEQKRELWTRWKNGQSLSDIGRALGKQAASVFGVIVAKGGIAPPARARCQASLTAEEREEISRGLVAGLSSRRIAAELGRAPSIVSREVRRNNGEVRITDTTIDVVYAGHSVAAHSRSVLRRRHTTTPEHIPSAHRRYASWTPDWMRSFAVEIGPATTALVEVIMSAKPHPEQGFRVCLGILQLARPTAPLAWRRPAKAV